MEAERAHLTHKVGLTAAKDLSRGEERLILREYQLAAEGGRQLVDEGLEMEAALRLEQCLARGGGGLSMSAQRLEGVPRVEGNGGRSADDDGGRAQMMMGV